MSSLPIIGNKRIQLQQTVSGSQSQEHMITLQFNNLYSKLYFIDTNSNLRTSLGRSDAIVMLPFDLCWK